MLPPRLPVLYLARHVQTIHNAVGILQGRENHTPLSTRGFRQAQAMGQALRAHFGPSPALALWCSSAGRTQQTLSLIAEHLNLSFFTAASDARLDEIDVGRWQHRHIREVEAELGRPVLDRKRRLFTEPAPDGEWYDAIADRLTAWLHDVADSPQPILAISHGFTTRILRGLLTGGDVPDVTPPVTVALAPPLPQGSIVRIADGVETVVHLGDGPASAPATGDGG